MSEYIWYIVGGISLFFIIIGFVADKSGLAKKTFSKNSDTKKVQANNEQVNLDKINSLIDEVNIDLEKDEDNYQASVDDDSLNSNDNIIPESNDDEGNYVIDDFLNTNSNEENILEDNSQIEELNESNLEIEEASLVNDNNLMESDSEPNNLYLNDGETNDSYDDLDKAYLEVEEPIYSEQAEESESVWDQEEAANVTEIQDDSVSQEDWKIESEEKIEESNQNLENIELPSLDDLNIGDDEDVWKF